MAGGVRNLTVTADKETELYPSRSKTAQGQLHVIKKHEKLVVEVFKLSSNVN